MNIAAAVSVFDIKPSPTDVNNIIVNITSNTSPILTLDIALNDPELESFVVLLHSLDNQVEVQTTIRNTNLTIPAVVCQSLHAAYFECVAVATFGDFDDFVSSLTSLVH